METAKELPEDIALALEGLQQQAGVATRMLKARERGTPEDLKSAHGKMAFRPGATKTVLKYVHETGQSVPDVQPQALLDWLMEKNDLHVLHLQEKPMYLAACRKVDGEDIYFNTRFWGDVEGCCGMSPILSEAEEMQQGAHEGFEVSVLPDDHPKRQALLKACLRPDLVVQVFDVSMPCKIM